MTLLEAIILGLIQGLTEFIPVSSSGHLVVAQILFGRTPSHLFLEFINIGTALALVVFFWGRLVEIAREVVVDRNLVMARNVLITALPAGVIGFTFADFIAINPFFANGWVVVVTLASVGAVMVLLPRIPKASSLSRAENLSPQRALAIGFAQALALVPGVSRSGSTIIAGRLAGLKAAQAAEYSFLVSIPIMIGVTAKVLLSDQQYLVDNMYILLAGNAVAFISGLFAVGFLMRYLQRHELAVFGWYRIGLAAVISVIFLVQ